jgi:hypothetical protein
MKYEMKTSTKINCNGSGNDDEAARAALDMAPSQNGFFIAP